MPGSLSALDVAAGTASVTRRLRILLPMPCAHACTRYVVSSHLCSSADELSSRDYL